MIVILVVVLLCVFYVYWRYVWFHRDPSREIPTGKNIVSPADGRVVYIKKAAHGQMPVSEKKGRTIALKEDLKMITRGEKYLIGIFLNPFDVHVQRAPIAGKVKMVKHHKHKNLPMTMMWLRTFLSLEPFYRYSEHMWENERNIILIEGSFPVYVVQIADLIVNRVVSFVRKGSSVKKGDRIGMIKFGSQVDVAFHSKGVKVMVKEGDRVVAGETILAKY